MFIVISSVNILAIFLKLMVSKLFVLKLLCPQNKCFFFLVIFNSIDVDLTVSVQSFNPVFLEVSIEKICYRISHI